MSTTTSSSQQHHNQPKMSFEEFKKEFKGEILEPDNDRYNKRLERFYSQTTVESTGKPKYIVGPKNSQDVITAIKFSTRNPDICKEGFAIISGGHWVGKNCCEGVLIDLNMNLNKVEIIDHTSTQSRKAFKVQGGATWDEVDRVGIQQGLATTSANNCGNGVVATALAGGYGFLAGQFGLGVDNVLEVDMVLADGQLVTANEKKHSDLFWAVRGAGPSLGCITSITLQAHKQDRQVCMGNLKFLGDRVNEVAQACTKWNQSCGNRGAAVIAMTKPMKDQPTMLNVHTFYNGNEAEAKEKFEVLCQAGPVEQVFSMINYEDANRVLENYAPHNHIEGQGANRPLAQTGAICTALNERNLKGVMERFEQVLNENEDFNTSAILIDLYPDLAKNVNKADSDMCFNGRTRIHPVNILLQYNNKDNMEYAQERARTLSKLFMDLDPSPNDLVRVPRYAAYTPDLPAKECWGENYHRLRKIKGEYDPQNYFNRWIMVEPEHKKA